MHKGHEAVKLFVQKRQHDALAGTACGSKLLERGGIARRGRFNHNDHNCGTCGDRETGAVEILDPGMNFRTSDETSNETVA